MTGDDKPGKKKKALVVTEEEGLVVTDSAADALEARIIQSVRKPFYMVGFLLAFVFVMMIGGAVLMDRLSDTLHHTDKTVNNTDQIISAAVSPEARAKQAQSIKDILAQVDCQDQRNLQRLIDKLVNAGFVQLKAVGSIVEEECKVGG